MNSPAAELPIQSAPRKGGVWHVFSAWLPVLFCIFVISQESTVYFGADHTSQPLQRFFEWILHRHFTQPQWWRLHITIRKLGHFTGYGLLSIAWFRAFWMTYQTARPFGRRRVSAHTLAMLGTLFVASCDELHQLYLPNRSGSIIDVMVDCSGAAVMQIFIWLWMHRRYSA